MDSLFLVEIKLKWSGIFGCYNLSAALANIKSPGHSKIDLQETKGNQRADISARNAALKRGRNSHFSIIAQLDTSLADNLEKSARGVQWLASEKKK